MLKIQLKIMIRVVFEITSTLLRRNSDHQKKTLTLAPSFIFSHWNGDRKKKSIKWEKIVT